MRRRIPAIFINPIFRLLCYNKREVMRMDYREHIQKAVDHIEAHLREELDNASLSRTAGYSEYHFLRVFRETTGLTPADYIRKRRISEIVREMLTQNDRRSIADIAFSYGFNSSENFIRAFKREHHILPKDFRTAQNSLKLYGRLDLSEESTCQAEASLIWLKPFCAVVYPSTEDFPPHFWNIYNTSGRSKKLSGGKTVEDCGVCRRNRETGKLDYWIGVRESDALGDTSGTVTLDIAGGLYAVFDTPAAEPFEFINTVHKTWDYIARVWLPENGFRRTGGYEFESYAEDSRTYSERIYIPIEKEAHETEE